MIQDLKQKHKDSFLVVNSKGFEPDESDNMISFEIVTCEDFPRKKFEKFFLNEVVSKETTITGRYIGESLENFGEGLFLGFKADRYKLATPLVNMEKLFSEISKYKNGSIDSVRLCESWSSHPLDDVMAQVKSEPMPFAALIYKRLKVGEVQHLAQLGFEDIILDAIGAPQDLATRAYIQYDNAKEHARLQRAMAHVVKNGAKSGVFSVIGDSNELTTFKANSFAEIDITIAEEYFI